MNSVFLGGATAYYGGHLAIFTAMLLKERIYDRVGILNLLSKAWVSWDCARGGELPGEQFSNYL